MTNLLPKDQADRIRTNEVAEQESAVQTCMAQQGFTYYPTAVGALIDLHSTVDPQSLSDAQRYGFGVVSLPSFQKQGPQNNDYYHSLSAADQARYDRADSTCADSATSKIHDQSGETLASKLYPKLEKALSQSDEYRSAEKRWSACASTVGYDFPDRETLIASFSKRRAAVVQQAGKISGASVTADSAALGSDADLISLQQDEIKAAVATFPCSQDLLKVRTQVITKILDQG